MVGLWTDVQSKLGEDRLLADISIDEQGKVRKDRGQAVEPAEGLIRLLQKPLDGIQAQRRIGRKLGAARTPGRSP